MNTTTVLQTRIPKKDKELADAICQQLGLSLNDALRVFVKSIINTRSIPVNLSLPQAVPEREPTDAELQAIEEFIANPQPASEEEVKELEELLGIKLRAS